MDKKKFGSFIREKRIDKNLTQKGLADLLFLDVTAVSKWERGISYPDITLIPDICKYLDVSEHELIESSGDTEYRKFREQASKYRKLKNGIFYGFSLLYATAVLTCFIVNLAVEKRLSWFFIVLVSCLAGFSFLPTFLRFFEKYKLSVFIVTTFFSLFLVYLTCSLYTSDHWFMIAALGTLLGYFAFFYPALFLKQRAYLKNYEAFSRIFLLTYITGLLILTLALLLSIFFYSPFSLGMGVLITLYCSTVFFAYGIIELFPIRRLIRVGIDFLLTDVFLIGLRSILPRLLGEENFSPFCINFTDWSNYVNENVTFIILSTFFLIGVIFMIFGVLHPKKA